MKTQPTQESETEARDLLCSCRSEGLPEHPTMRLHHKWCLWRNACGEDIVRIALALDRIKEKKKS